MTVSAHNEFGWGGVALHASAVTPANQQPSKPVLFRVTPHSSTELLAQWSAPRSTGGLTISKYDVEWDVSSTFNSGSGGVAFGSASVEAVVAPTLDVQTVTATASQADLGGTFTLTFNGQTTEAIDAHATAATMEAAIEQLCTVEIGRAHV